MNEHLRRGVAHCVRYFVTYLPPKRKGMTAVARLERWIHQPSSPMSVRHISGYVVALDLTDDVQKSMYYRGTWEPQESDLVTQSLPRGGVLVDVGANAGHYMLLGAAAVGRQGSVHAIEASPRMAEHLKRTALENQLGSVVAVHAVAAGDAAGHLMLQGVDGSTHVGSRYLDPLAISGERVPVVRLDELLAGLTRCDVIKLDVEGCDLSALRGAKDLIDRCRPKLILAEAADGLLQRFGDSSEGMIDYMASLGYGFEWLEKHVESPTLIFRPASR